MVKFLVNYLYDENDGYDQEHKEFMVKWNLFGIVVGCVTILVVSV